MLNLEEKKSKSQTIFLTPKASKKKAEFGIFGVKKTNRQPYHLCEIRIELWIFKIFDFFGFSSLNDRQFKALVDEVANNVR